MCTSDARTKQLLPVVLSTTTASIAQWKEGLVLEIHCTTTTTHTQTHAIVREIQGRL
jgi:hypothetical protein